MVAQLDGRNFTRLTKEELLTTRNRIEWDLELPMKEDYQSFLINLIGYCKPSMQRNTNSWISNCRLQAKK